ncbi:hypothetical protein [Bacillus licheniformis]|uniref:hypothetical protein n=1 Tax=Bacillus licheniformis TaxID=1402 RepID=UPI0011A6045B|nr:hypothetical protein [Bacillus licheniformis]MDQ9094276.1 hypothetical protein [Bacillus licheniformis]MEC0478495.1 hypothetical protein [Bacillus licheniformis]MEC0490079.1 hypothetical protein [Bacillus licheniformis]
MNEFFVIAGKAEGFSYSDAAIHRVGSEVNVEIAINQLRGEGYKVFYVSRIVERIDDNVIGE